MPLACKSLPELLEEASRLRADGESDVLFKDVLNMSPQTVSIHNIHGDLDQLVRIAYVAANVLKIQHMALFVVDHKHYDDAVALLTKHFPSTKSPDFDLKIDPATGPPMPAPDVVDFGSFKVIRGGPEDRKSRMDTPTGTNEYWKVAHPSTRTSQAVDRVIDALTAFGGYNEEKESVLPEFVWHNATSSELLVAMPQDLMKKKCKAIFFASGVILTPTCFIAGAHYAWDSFGHEELVKRVAEWKSVPLIYYHGSTMGLKQQTLSQLPGFINAVAGLLPKEQSMKLNFESMDQVAVWLIRWSEGKAGRYGQEAVDHAVEAFSTMADKNKGWVKKVFKASSYPAEQTKVADFSERAVSIAQDIRCPVNQSLGAAAGMVLDNREIPSARLTPSKIDWQNLQLTVDKSANTYIMTSNRHQGEDHDRDLDIDLESHLENNWNALVKELKLESNENKLSPEVAYIWVQYRKCVAEIAVGLGMGDGLDGMSEEEAMKLVDQVEGIVNAVYEGEFSGIVDTVADRVINEAAFGLNGSIDARGNREPEA